MSWDRRGREDRKRKEKVVGAETRKRGKGNINMGTYGYGRGECFGGVGRDVKGLGCSPLEDEEEDAEAVSDFRGGGGAVTISIRIRMYAVKVPCEEL